MSRTRRPAASVGRRVDPGFILVGVVMFVLALTILGLSLFALSGYEAQFLNQSYDSGQALYTAQSGIENAKFVLTYRRRLADVGTWLYPSDVVYARACVWRSNGTPDSVSSLDDLPDSSRVEIRVLANVDGQRRMLQTNVIAAKLPEVYKRLMSVTDSMIVKTMHEEATGPPDVCGQTYLTGAVYEGGRSGQSWWGCAHASAPTITNGLPTPNVEEFLDQHLNDASTRDTSTPSLDGPGVLSLTLDGVRGAKTTTYFRTMTDPYGSTLWSMQLPKFTGKGEHQPGNTIVNVHGWVVWMLPHGLRAETKMTIEGSSSTDCLVIVAGRSRGWTSDDVGYDRDETGLPGLWFRGSLESPNVPVILVSNGWVYDMHSNWDRWFYGSDVNYLSVFAKGVMIEGPVKNDEPLPNLNLQHLPNGDFDKPGKLIDQLCRLGALPNSQSGSTAFKSVPGTWLELDPDSPPN